MSNMGKGLCRRCIHYQHVEFKELGRVIENCRVFDGVRSVPSPVTKCTNFSASDESYIFGREAWIGYKMDDGGTKFYPPGQSPYDGPSSPTTRTL